MDSQCESSSVRVLQQRRLDPIEGAVIFIGDTNGLILSLAMVWLVLKLVAKRI